MEMEIESSNQQIDKEMDELVNNLNICLIKKRNKEEEYTYLFEMYKKLEIHLFDTSLNYNEILDMRISLEELVKLYFNYVSKIIDSKESYFEKIKCPEYSIYTLNKEILDYYMNTSNFDFFHHVYHLLSKIIQVLDFYEQENVEQEEEADNADDELEELDRLNDLNLDVDSDYGIYDCRNCL